MFDTGTLQEHNVPLGCVCSSWCMVCVVGVGDFATGTAIPSEENREAWKQKKGNLFAPSSLSGEKNPQTYSPHTFFRSTGAPCLAPGDMGHRWRAMPW